MIPTARKILQTPPAVGSTAQPPAESRIAGGRPVIGIWKK
jgi:hypothetical protein